LTLYFKIEILGVNGDDLGKFPLHTNLTKWLSRCEGAFHKGKDKKTLYGDMYAIAEIKKKTRKY